MCNTTTSILDNASPPTDVPAAATVETTEAASAVVEEEDDNDFVDAAGKLIQDFAHSDNARVNTALDTLSLDLDNNKEKCDTIIIWGGCAALVHLLKDRLKKAMRKVPACDQVTELNEFPDLETIGKTLCVIVRFTYYTEMGRVGISTVGGVEVAVTVMKTFPKCQPLQERACGALLNLASRSIGKTKAIEAGGIEVLLAAVTTHLNSANVCEHACWALHDIASNIKENVWQLISLGGGAAVAKVRTKWPDNNDVQIQVRKLADLIGAEMTALANAV